MSNELTQLWARDPLSEFGAVVPGNPGRATVNKKLKPVLINGRAQVRNGSDYTGWKSLAVLALRRAAEGRAFGPGPLRVDVGAFWPRRHRVGPAAGLAVGDVDAITKAVLDALQSAGVLLDDAQVVSTWQSKHVDKANPRVEISIRRIEGA